MNNRLKYHFSNHSILSERQYGFTPQRSTEDAISFVCDKVYKQFNIKAFTLLVSLDIKGAFDSAWWPQILNQLRTNKCPENIYKLLKSYLSERQVLFNYGEVQTRKALNRGCPQGSVLGPTLWNVLYNQLLDLDLPSGAQIIGFADDTMLIVTACKAKQIETIANKSLEIISNWSRKVKLVFNATKTSVMLVTKKLKYDKPNIILDGQPLQLCDCFKYLGVTLDKNFNFSKHINMCLEKATKLNHQLARVAANNWGISSEALRTIYIGAIEPIITYCSSIWSHRTKIKSIKRKLLSFQRQIAIRIIKGYRTISEDAAILLANLVPLDLKIQEIANHYKLKRGEQVYTLDGKMMQKPIEFKTMPHPVIRLKIKLSFENNNNNNNEHRTEIYTDGSKIDDRTSAAFVAFDNLQNCEKASKQYRLDGKCSVFQAELIAIEKVLIWLCDQPKQQKIGIYSDSISALKAIRNTSFNPIIFNIRKILFEQRKEYDIRFYWIKAHNGTLRNERADQLAKQTSENAEIVYQHYPQSFAKRYLRAKSIEIWNQRWIDTTKGQITHQFLPTVYTRISLKHFKTNYIVTQYLTNHGKFNKYLNRFKVEDSPLCHCNNESEDDVYHRIFYCNKYITERCQLQNIANSLGIQLNCQNIIKNNELFTEFISFVNKIHDKCIE